MTGASETFSLGRRAVVDRLLANRGDMLVVAGLGAAAWDVAAVGDHDLDFPLWGAMGGAAMVGLGLAVAQPGRRVLVITGDGEMLMGLGALATIAVQGTANLAVAVLDNERYGETGMQETHTAHGADLAAMARAAGFPVTALARDGDGLDSSVRLLRDAPGPVFVTIKVRAETPPLVLPPQDGVELKDRFRAALLGAP
ncbi:MAG: thiamine pyrophosphate-dependent enzyme [Pseudomonadota bacterium]|nr:thiamine pyrophosphate-dependent enzyme [Pseudomonadota bacterium]